MLPSILVSCIMPTYNRRKWIPGAVKCFLSQTWKEKELIVVDDGEEPVFDLVANVPGIVYLRFHDRMKIGRKRNIANEHAAGDLIAHWDDDDYYAPTRLEKQIGTLIKNGAQVTGFRDMLFWDGKRVLSHLCADNYACGTSLVYQKEYWRNHRFPDVMIGEDNHLVYRAGKSLVTEFGRGMVVASIHQKNTSPKTSSDFPEVRPNELPDGLVATLQSHFKPETRSKKQ